MGPREWAQVVCLGHRRLCQLSHSASPCVIISKVKRPNVFSDTCNSSSLWYWGRRVTSLRPACEALSQSNTNNSKNPNKSKDYSLSVKCLWQALIYWWQVPSCWCCLRGCRSFTVKPCWRKHITGIDAEVVLSIPPSRSFSASWPQRAALATVIPYHMDPVLLEPH